ncbi:MAG TPA: hypothetical protein PLA50_00270, partial [Bacteroidia bacterium]|nr:hypothetical protein [Bacteroidia bacterium]
KPESLEDEPVDLLRVTWDDRHVSRNHCEAVRDENDHLAIRRLPALTGRNTPNPLNSNIAPKDRHPLVEPVELRLGESFVFGAGGQTAVYWLKSLGDLEAELE